MNQRYTGSQVILVPVHTRGDETRYRLAVTIPCRSGLAYKALHFPTFSADEMAAVLPLLSPDHQQPVDCRVNVIRCIQGNHLVPWATVAVGVYQYENARELQTVCKGCYDAYLTACEERKAAERSELYFRLGLPEASPFK